MSRNLRFKYNYQTVTFFSFIFLFLTALNYLSDWWVFKVSGSAEAKIREASNFSDLQSILSYVPCYRNVGNSIYLFDNFSPCYKGYIYGTPLLDFFSAIRLDTIPLVIVGSTLIIFFCLGLAVLASKVLIRERIPLYFIVCSLFSPGIWLLLERTNLDILVFLMLLIGSQLFSRGSEIWGFLIIALSALFKFYTLPVLVVLLVITSKRLTRIVGILVTIPVFLKVFLDISSITNPGFPSTWYISFGYGSFGLYINLFLEHFGKNALQMNSSGIRLFGYSIILITVVFLIKYSKIKLIATSKILLKSSKDMESNFLINSFWIFGTTFVSCYMAGMSYDYRLLFLAVTGLAFIGLTNFQEDGLKTLYFLLVLSLWCSGSFLPTTSLVLSGLIQLIGDTVILFLVASFFVIGISGLKAKLGTTGRN